MPNAAKTILILVVLSLVSGATAQPARPGFGRQWVKTHDFTIDALVTRSTTLHMGYYAGANMNVLLEWKNRDGINDKINDFGIRWHIVGVRKNITASDEEFAVIVQDTRQDLIQRLATYPGCEAMLTWDEGNFNQFAFTRMIPQHQWARAAFPDLLHLTNIYGSGKESFGSYGTDPDTGLPYADYYEYVLDMIHYTGVDVVSFDSYPIRNECTTAECLQALWFKSLIDVRNAALVYDIPYWCFIQAMESFNDGKWRLPNELQLRLMVFSALTYGYTGLQYFIYEAADVYQHTIVDSEGKPNLVLYVPITQINAEAFNIGQAIRQLRSTDVRTVNAPVDFVPRVDPFSASAPAALACGIQYIDTDGACLIGFFEDDDSYPYFMLTDLSYDDGATPESAATNYTIHFDDSIDTVHRLHRETGDIATLAPVNGDISITLPGGTGELFKVGGNPVFGIEYPVGDLNRDRQVDLRDLAVLLSNWFD